ncbi:hypothetical protein EC973_003598 [Apophysomyces ossiformis]|uniref:F-box domain-containing protein n=1 Tax=Apophysomyces ossiformis TaxID=679940 RepID=A0A8H7BQJ2_9FUNG|nr:hypothetical protein EC973_003598 [Apophysomyces ossiformis]
MHKRRGRFPDPNGDKKKQTKISETAAQDDISSISVKDSTWKHYFADARKAFDESRYKDALTLFTHALDFSPGNITVLDCRAATYEKLGDLQAALNDGSTMVGLAPAASKGYLRLGKVLSLQKKVKPAYAIYKRAMQRVDPKDARYSIIMNLKDAAERQVTLENNRRRSRDFVSVLPYDILCCIFSYLSFQRRIQCTAVCKTWRNFTLTWPSMWRNLEFGPNVVSPYTVKQYLSYAKSKHIRSISLHGVRSEEKMRKILQHLLDQNCCYLEKLEISESCVPVPELFRILKITSNTLTHLRLDGTTLPFKIMIYTITQHFSNITHVSFREFRFTDISPHSSTMSPSNIVLLDISPSEGVSIPAFAIDDILNECQNLRHLQMVCDDGSTLHVLRMIRTICPHIITLRLSETQFPPLEIADTVDLKPGLREFSIPYVHGFSEADAIDMIALNHATLETLDLRGCGALSSEFAARLATRRCPRLKTLYLASNAGLSEQDLLAIIQACPSLQIVDLSSILNVSNAILCELSGLQSLRHIDISCCIKVTGAGIRRLIEARKDTLERLVINDCTGISADAVHFAREQLGRYMVECRIRGSKR